MQCLWILHNKNEIKYKVPLSFLPTYPPRPTLRRLDLGFYLLHFPVCLEACKVGPNIPDGARDSEINQEDEAAFIATNILWEVSWSNKRAPWRMYQLISPFSCLYIIIYIMRLHLKSPNLEGLEPVYKEAEQRF